MVRNEIEKMEFNEYAESNEAEFDMSLNENPLGPSPEVMEAIRNISPEMVSRYQHPDFRIREKLGRFLDANEEYIILTNGCDPAIEMAAQTFFDSNTEVAIPVPSFHRYRIHAQKMGANIREIRPKSGYHPNLQRLCDVQADYMILANPQNPSGERFTLDQMKKLNEEFGGHLLIDEAMAHFNQNHSSLINEGATVMGSFSKIFGLAGLRAGYIVSEEINSLKKTGSPFKLNSVAQEAVETVLDEEKYLEQTRKAVKTELDRLKSGIEDLGIRCSGSECLTLLIDLRGSKYETKSTELVEELNNRGIKVIDGSNFKSLDNNHLRISVREKETNQKFLKELSDIFESESIKEKVGEI